MPAATRTLYRGQMGNRDDHTPSDDTDPETTEGTQSRYIGIGIALGVSIGVGLSIALDNWAFAGLGISLGVVFGVVLGQQATAEPADDSPDADDDSTPHHDPTP